MKQKQIGLVFLIVVIIFNLPTFLLSFSSVPERKGASFYGKLETHEGGKTYTIENIAIGEEGKTKKIPFYEKPQSHDPAVKAGEKETIELKIDPKTELVKATIDLDELIKEELVVPNRHVLWVYKGKEGFRGQDYIEIERKKDGLSKGSYLIESSTMLYADHILDNGSESTKSEKLTVPIVTIKSLIVEGYSCPAKESPDNPEKRVSDCCVK